MGGVPKWCLAMVLAVAWGGAAWAEPKRVYLVNSYNPEYFWSAHQREGVEAALKGLDVVVREVFLDTKRHPEPEWLENQVAECLADIEAFRPDIVFTGDDNATRTVAKHLLKSDTPVVFYGLNAEPESYGLVEQGQRHRPGGNVTGVLERHLFVDAVHLLETVTRSNRLPIVELFLLTDGTYTSTRLFQVLKAAEWNVSMTVTFLPQIDTFEVYQDTIRNINRPGNAVFIYNLMGVRFPDGTRLHDREIMAWTRGELAIPSVAFHESYIEEGALLGIVVSGYSQAYHAGLKGRQILTGATPGSIPIDSPDRGKATLNSSTLKRLGLKVPLSVLLGATVFQNDDG